VPDIDLEFASQYRAGIFTWAVRHYGQDKVARVGSWHHTQGRSAFAAAALAHGLPKAHLRPLTESLGAGLESLESGEGPAPEDLAVPPAGFPLDPAVWPKVIAALHVAARHGGSIRSVVVLEVNIPRRWLKRHSTPGVYYVPRDIPPERIIGVRVFDRLAASPAA
jgi:hypothetical protein